MKNSKTEKGLGLSSIEESVKAYERRISSSSVKEVELERQDRDLQQKIEQLKQDNAKQQQRYSELSKISQSGDSKYPAFFQDVYSVSNRRELEQKIKEKQDQIQALEYLSNENPDPAFVERSKQEILDNQVYLGQYQNISSSYSNDKELESHLSSKRELWNSFDSPERLDNILKYEIPRSIESKSERVSKSEAQREKVKENLIYQQKKREQLAAHKLEGQTQTSMSPQFLQRDITRRSREKGIIGQSLQMAQSKGYFQLQEQFDAETGELGATESQISQLSMTPENETPEQRQERLGALKQSAQLRQERVGYLGTIQGALRQQRKGKYDPESIVSESSKIIQKSEQRQFEEGLIDKATSGELGSEKDVKAKLLQSELELAKAHDEYRRALESIGTEAEKTAEELDSLGDRVRKQSTEVQTRQTELSAVQNHGDGETSFLNVLAPLAALIRNGAQVYQHAAVTSEIGQAYGQSSLANTTVNSRFFDAMKSGRDAGAMLRTVGAYGDVFEQAGKAYNTTGITRTAVAGADAIDSTGNVISKALTGGWAGGVTAGANAAGDLARTGIDLYKGIPQSQQAAEMAESRKARFNAFTAMDASVMDATRDWGINVAHSTRGFGSVKPGDGGGGGFGKSESVKAIADRALGSASYSMDDSEVERIRKGTFDPNIKKATNILFGSENLAKEVGFSGPINPSLATSSLELKRTQDTRASGFLNYLTGDSGFKDTDKQASAANFIAKDSSRKYAAEDYEVAESLSFTTKSRSRLAKSALLDIEGKYQDPESRAKLGEQLAASGYKGTVTEFVETLTDGLKKVAENGDHLFSSLEKTVMDVANKVAEAESGTASSGSTSSLYKGGRGREAFVQALTNKDWLRETIATSGLSENEVLSAARTGRDAIGAEFVKEGPEGIRDAGRLASHGYFSSADQYLSTRGMMSETMGDSKNRLEEVMSAAVAKGMDSSKNIVALAQSSSSMAAAYAARGIDAGKGTNQMLLGGWQAGISAGLSPNMAVAAAQQSAGVLNAAASDTSLNLTGMMEANEYMKMGITDPRTISVLQGMDMTELASMSDSKLESLGLDSSKRKEYQSIKRPKSAMSVMGGLMDNKMGGIIEKLQSGGDLSKEEEVTFNQGVFQAKASPEIFKAQLLGKGFSKGAVDRSAVTAEEAPDSAVKLAEGLNTTVNQNNAAILTETKGNMQGDMSAITAGLQTVVINMNKLLPLLQQSLSNVQQGKGGEFSGANIGAFNSGASALGSAATKLDSAATKLSSHKN